MIAPAAPTSRIGRSSSGKRCGHLGSPAPLAAVLRPGAPLASLDPPLGAPWALSAARAPLAVRRTNAPLAPGRRKDPPLKDPALNGPARTAPALAQPRM